MDIGWLGVSVVAGSILLYVCLFFLARHTDRFNKVKRCVIDVMDNDPEDSQIYLVTVHTGSRLGAGSSVPVTLILRGENGASLPHVLECWEYPVLQRNDVSTFLIRHYMSLAELYEVELWLSDQQSPFYKQRKHSWYVRQIIIEDVQSKKLYKSQCNSWLTDKTPDRIFSVVPYQTMGSSSLTKTLKEYHSWWSIYQHLPWSDYTSIHRVLHTAILLVMQMLLSILVCGLGVNPTIGGDRLISLFYNDYAMWLEQYVADLLGATPFFLRGVLGAILLFPIQGVVELLLRYTSPQQPSEPLCNYRRLITILCHPELLKRHKIPPNIREKVIDLASNYNIKQIVSNQKSEYAKSVGAPGISEVRSCISSEDASFIHHLPDVTPSINRLLEHSKDKDIVTRMRELTADDHDDAILDDLPQYPTHKWHSITKMFDVNASKFTEFELTLPETHILFRLEMLRYYNEFITEHMCTHLTVEEIEQLGKRLNQVYNPCAAAGEPALLDPQWMPTEAELDLMSKLDVEESNLETEDDYPMDEGLIRDQRLVGADLSHDMNILSVDTPQPVVQLPEMQLSLPTQSVSQPVDDQQATMDEESANESTPLVMSYEPVPESKWNIWWIGIYVMLSLVLLFCLTLIVFYVINYGPEISSSIPWLAVLGTGLSVDMFALQLLKIYFLALVNCGASESERLPHIDRQALTSNNMGTEYSVLIKESLKWLRDHPDYNPPTTNPHDNTSSLEQISSHD